MSCESPANSSKGFDQRKGFPQIYAKETTMVNLFNCVGCR
jgi:hypothetical protein